MRKRSADERAVLFQEMLPGVAAEADATAKREARSQPAIAGGFRLGWLIAAAALVQYELGGV